MITNDDWQAFTADVTWFLHGRGPVVVGETRAWTRGGVEGTPTLTSLLGSARLTPVSVDGTTYELLAWDGPGGPRGWLCLPPSASTEDDTTRLPAVLHSFWKVSGGIIERFGEPHSWWLNQNDVLTRGAVGLALADVLADYAWLWDDDGLEMPIRPLDFCVVAVEANGNLTLAHRESGHLLLFAPDHAFDGVTPLSGCPPYSLMTIDGLADLASWIEDGAAAWSMARGK